MTPALSWPIIAAVLFGALLHASWNALIKSGDDKALDTALIHVLGCGVHRPEQVRFDPNDGPLPCVDIDVRHHDASPSSRSAPIGIRPALAQEKAWLQAMYRRA